MTHCHAYFPLMPHRSNSRRVLDDAAFPLRLKLRVPAVGLGPAWLEMLDWLRHEVGEGNFARHEADTLEGDALALHFRRLEDAAAFLEAFPRARLADDTTSRAYRPLPVLKEPLGHGEPRRLR